MAQLYAHQSGELAGRPGLASCEWDSREFLSPAEAGWRCCAASDPRAYALGYLLPSLREGCSDLDDRAIPGPQVRGTGGTHSEIYTGPMIRAKPIVLSALALICAGGLAQREENDPWAKYQHRTIQSIIDVHYGSALDTDPTLAGAHKNVLLSSDSFPSRTTLVFLGKSRPLQGERAELMSQWGKMMGRTEDLAALFSTEMLFREGSNEFWLPVQRPLLDPLLKEVGIGRPFSACVIWMGGVRTEGQWDWLFAMNEFDSPPGAPPPQKSGR